MTANTSGLHHVTAIAGDPQANIDFYVKGLGLRLVKKTVNFDDPSTYHLYYGDEAGQPGTLMTFFPWRGIAPGRIGPGHPPPPRSRPGRHAGLVAEALQSTGRRIQHQP
jgi:glyoxalase family protein